jgi:hypothetical protein
MEARDTVKMSQEKEKVPRWLRHPEGPEVWD